MSERAAWHDGDLLAFDLETTGVDRFGDVPVSFALVHLVGSTVVSVEASLVDPGRPIPAGATAVHGITTERARTDGMPLDAAARLMANALAAASGSSVPVVGMNLDFDLTMLDACCRRLNGPGLEELGFCGPVLDALVLDRHLDRYRKGRRTLGDLCRHYEVVMDRAHDATADAAASAGVIAALCRRYPELCRSTPAELHGAQAAWHREWAVSFSEWRRAKGLAPLDDLDAQWPIASATGSGASILPGSGESALAGLAVG